MCNRFIDKFVEKVIEKTKNPLKLYHVTILPGVETHLSYDSCSEFVTANYTEDEARNMDPGFDWVRDVNNLQVTEIGHASENMVPGIIIKHIYYG